jgi:hypothetical protein
MPFFTRLLTPILLVAVFVSGNVRAVEGPAESTIDLAPRVGTAELAQVTIELDAGGTLWVRPTKDRSADERKLPMSVVAKLQYDEHRVAPPTGGHPVRAVRWYDVAEAVIKVDDAGTTPKLADDRRLIVVQNPGGRLNVSSPRGLLTREELDLVDVTGDSLVVDGLLPGAPVADGGTWPADPDVIAGLLSLDSVAACEVESVLDKFNHDFALVRLAGSVVGTTDGSATEMEVRGVYLFDRRLGRVTRFNLAVKENRSIGGATPGLDGVAKLRLNIKPIESSAHLPEATLAPLRTASKLRLDMLRLDAADQGYRIFHDRQWFVTSRERETTTLRRVERGDVLAQCTITSLPAKSAGRQTTLDEFERDIRYSLRENFGQLVASRQWTNAFKHHCLEVVVRGTAEEVPVEWRYYLVAPESGNRVSVAVTIDGQMVERLASADRALVNAIQLVPPTGRVAAGNPPPIERSLVVPAR